MNRYNIYIKYKVHRKTAGHANACSFRDSYVDKYTEYKYLKTFIKKI